MKLVEHPVKRTLFSMALPMLVGTIAMNAYNLADTWYVSRLGTIPLAAMGFTFPVVMLFTFLAGGIGTGITALTSHAIGRSDKTSGSRIVTHGVLFMALFALLLSIAGYVTIDIVFRRLGANTEVFPYIQRYMGIWYLGAVTMIFPMTGNGILIAMGDSKSASLFMATGAILNCILDPIMIYGWLGFPAMGIAGAALATVIAQFIAALWLFYLLTYKHKLLHLAHPDLSTFTTTIRKILGFAIPGSISMMLMPISAGVITALLSRHGNEAVAAASAAGRVEMFAFVIPMALGMSLMPFISQNYGAGRMDRIYQAKRYAINFAFIYGIVIAGIFFAAAPLMARLFTDNATVMEIFIAYVRTISFGYGMMEIHRYSGFMMTGMHKPVYATLLNMVRVVVLLIPLSYVGSLVWGVRGIFYGRLITDIVAGAIGLLWVGVVIQRKMIAK